MTNCNYIAAMILLSVPAGSCFTKAPPPQTTEATNVSQEKADSRMSAENRLITDILTNYSRYGRPISNVSQAVQVSISFYLTQLMALEEKHQVLTTFGWLDTFWRDEYLMWNASEYEGLGELVLSPELVWLPDFGVENSAKAIYDELFFKRFRVSVTSDGLVNWMPGGKFITSCQLDITYYPFDDQECHIDLVDWAYHGLQVKLVNGSHVVGLDAYTKSGEWTIISTEAISGDNYYDSDPGVPFPRVRFTIKLKRKPMFYTINIITPCITMSLLALLVFYLPPDSGEKVSLGITVLLSFSVFLLLVAENVPKTSEYVPLLGIYLTLIMAMTAMSILICVIVLNLHHRDPDAPVPRWLRSLTYNIMAPLVCMQSHTKYHKKVHDHHTAMYNPVNSYAMNDNYIVEDSNVNNTEQVKSHSNAGTSSARYSSQYKNIKKTPSRKKHTSSSTINSSMNDNAFSNHLNYIANVYKMENKKQILEEILYHVRQITSKLREDEDEGILRADWRIVAKILDRFFLLMFVLLVVVSSSVLLVIYPLMRVV